MVKRKTKATTALLRAILADPDADHYGLDLSRTTGLKSGTLYPILDRLEDDGWLTARWEDDDTTRGPRRRFYRLTDLGKLEAAALVD